MPEESAKAERIASIRADGFEPIFEVIESYEDRNVALGREIYWIQTYESQGIVLVNKRHSQKKNSLLFALVEKPRKAEKLLKKEILKVETFDIQERFYTLWKAFWAERYMIMGLNDIIDQFLQTIPPGLYWPEEEDALRRETFKLAVIATMPGMLNGHLI
jgi:hypothetical protein